MNATMDKQTLEAILSVMIKVSAKADYQRNKREKDANNQYWYWRGRDDAFTYVVEYIRDEIERVGGQ